MPRITGVGIVCTRKGGYPVRTRTHTRTKPRRKNDRRLREGAAHSRRQRKVSQWRALGVPTEEARQPPL